MTSKRRSQPETKRALIVVRTYPTPAQSGVEVSCTAAIEEAGWLRLFPVPWRFLTEDKRFRRYQWIEVTATKASDPRPESFKIDPDSIRILSDKPLSAAKAWRARKDAIFPWRAHCLCCLKKKRDSDGFPTLGIFKPRSIDRLCIDPEPNPTWTNEELAVLRQEQLFSKTPVRELEKIPLAFRYEFRCDEDACKGHKLKCTDWEMGEAYRRWKRKYKLKWESAFRQRFEFEMIQRNDTHFYVGTLYQYPGTWIICGLFYPRRSPDSVSLFDQGV